MTNNKENAARPASASASASASAIVAARLAAYKERLTSEHSRWAEKKHTQERRRSDALKSARQLAELTQRKTLETLQREEDRTGKVMRRIEGERARVKNENHRREALAKQHVDAAAAERREWEERIERNQEHAAQKALKLHDREMHARAQTAAQREGLAHRRAQANLDTMMLHVRERRALTEEGEARKNRDREGLVAAQRKQKALASRACFEAAMAGHERAKRIEEANRGRVESAIEQEQRRHAKARRDAARVAVERRAAKEMQGRAVRAKVQEAEAARRAKEDEYLAKFELACAIGDVRRRHNSSVHLC